MNPKMILAGLLALLAAGPADGEASEPQKRAVLQRQVSQLYQHGEYAKLDEMFALARERSLRTESGIWQLWVMHLGITDGTEPPRDEAEAKVRMQRALDWKKQRPDSVEAPLVVAEVEFRHARALACGECEVDAGANRDELYRASLQRTYDLLQAARAKSAADPHKTHDTEGASMYARIWWYAAQVGYDGSLFKSTPVVWADFDAGIDDVMKRYPDDWNANNFANFACQAGHAARSRQLMAGHELIEQVWDSEAAYEHCIGGTQLDV